MTKDYVVVTTVSSFRHRYVMHKNDLQAMNAMDIVTMEKCDEFSQLHMGEQISDIYECSEDEMITFFDRDNDYLRSWDREQKIEWVRKTLTLNNLD